MKKKKRQGEVVLSVHHWVNRSILFSLPRKQSLLLLCRFFLLLRNILDTYKYVWIHVYVYTFTCLNIYLYIHCWCIHLCVYTFAYTNVCIHMYTTHSLEAYYTPVFALHLTMNFKYPSTVYPHITACLIFFSSFFKVGSNVANLELQTASLGVNGR